MSEADALKVTVSVMGRFWAFNLADQLHRRGCLRRLITTYPTFEAVKYGIPRSRVVSHLPVEVLSRGWHKAPSFLKNCYDTEFLFDEMTDRLAAMRIPKDTDLFVGLSSVSLHSMRQARKLGAVTIVERGSSHMRYQTRVLREEYDLVGMRPRVAHAKIMEKELQEYDEADYIAVPSGFVKRTFLDEGVPEKKLIHNPFGVDLAQFPSLPKTDRIFRVIHCGGLVLRKGVHYLLQAFSELKLPDAELWLIGTLDDEIVPFLKKYDNGKVFHRGPFRQGDLHRYYSQGSVFCLASVEEGLAMVIPQAMACGLPVICTTNTGGADLVREDHEGWVIPIRDVEGLKEKLLRLYEQPELCRSMGQAAKRRVTHGFTWDHYGDRAVEWYHKIAEEKTR